MSGTNFAPIPGETQLVNKSDGWIKMWHEMTEQVTAEIERRYPTAYARYIEHEAYSDDPREDLAAVVADHIGNLPNLNFGMSRWDLADEVVESLGLR